MDATTRTRTRNAEDKKQRIVAAAKRLFAEKGYSQVSIKDVAAEAEVSASLVILHYRSKPELFREALIDALTHASIGELTREGFGARLAEQIITGSDRVFSPSMIALSLDDAEARTVAAAVARDFLLKPTAEWLGGPQARERAMYIMLCSLGFALFSKLFAGELALDAADAPARWVARSMQEMVTGVADAAGPAD